MPAVQRVGDANDAGGTASGGISSVRVNNLAVIVDGDSVEAHAPWDRRGHPPHKAATTANGNGTVKAGGKPVVFTGAQDTCGHPRAGGSPNVRVG